MSCKASIEGSLVRSRFPGFDDEEVSSPEPEIVTPESASWGLSVAQMRAMGIAKTTDRPGNINPVSLLYVCPLAFYSLACCLGVQQLQEQSCQRY